MLTRNGFKTLSVLFWFMPVLSHAAIVSRVTTFSDGSVLFASDLNSEFNNLVNNINALDNDNIIAGAAISPSKISGTITGSGLLRDGTTGALSIDPDDVTVEISSNEVRLKDNGVSSAKLRQSAALSVVGNSTNATANVADIAAGSDGQVLRRSGTSIGFGTVAAAGLASNAVATATIQDGAVTQAKRAALGQQISASSGSFSLNGFPSGTTPTDVTNLSVTITTTGRPVFVGMIPGSSSAASVAHTWASLLTSTAWRIIFDRSGTTIANHYFGVTTSTGSGGSIHIADYACSAFNIVDVPSAGTYTYKVQMASTATSFTGYVTNCKLIAYEL